MQKDEQTRQQGQKDKYWGWWNIIAFSCGTNAALLKKQDPVKPYKYCQIRYSGGDEAFIYHNKNRESDLYLRQCIIRQVFIFNSSCFNRILSVVSSSHIYLFISWFQDLYCETSAGNGECHCQQLNRKKERAIHNQLEFISDWRENVYN